jgi:VWFA-related protein
MRRLAALCGLVLASLAIGWASAGRLYAQAATASQIPAGDSVWVLLVDKSSMTAADVQRAVKSAATWTEQRMSTADFVALLSVSSAKLEVLQDFTNDKSKVQAALDELAKGGPNTDLQSANESRLRALKTLCNDLRPIQQKKTLMYFSLGMQRNGTDDQVAMREATQSCVQANVTIATVDTRGHSRIGVHGAQPR